MINKWDRPGRHALELMDEIQARIGLRPTPLTWPVGIAGDFKGVLARRGGHFIRFTRTAGGATAAPEEHIAAADAHAAAGDDWNTAVEESELLSADGYDFDRAGFLGGESTPVLFTSAALNFGDCFTYGLAVASSSPVLCTGGDFAATDVEVVRPDDS